MTQYATDILAELVERKRQCLAQLCELGRRQCEMIASGEMNPLLKVLAGKQRLLADLQEIEEGLAPYHDEDPEARAWRSPADRQRCAGHLADCEKLLAVILEQERGSENELRRRRDEAQVRLQGAHDAAAARGAYLAATPAPALHELDLASES